MRAQTLPQDKGYLNKGYLMMMVTGHRVQEFNTINTLVLCVYNTVLHVRLYYQIWAITISLAGVTMTLCLYARSRFRSK